MAKQIFSPVHNMLARLTLIVLVLGGGATLVAIDVVGRSPLYYFTKVPRAQDVPFSHQHHARLGVDCRYCHTSVEDSAFANVPPTKTCMNCHKLIWNDAPMLEPVRQSMANNESLEWNRVHDLPDFVYFNHSIHVAKGIGCSTCHGRVDKMPLMWRENALYMKWCLECHRDPVEFVRPQDKVLDMAYDPKSLPRSDREALAKEYGIDHQNYRLTNCAICHR